MPGWINAKNSLKQPGGVGTAEAVPTHPEKVPAPGLCQRRVYHKRGDREVRPSVIRVALLNPHCLGFAIHDDRCRSITAGWQHLAGTSKAAEAPGSSVGPGRTHFEGVRLPGL